MSDFENFYNNSRKPEEEIKRINLCTEKDYLKTEDEINEKEYEKESINLEYENFVIENLSKDMILYYKKLSEKNENGYDIRTDEEGKKYIRHETKMKILGLTTGEAYYRMSDKNGQQTSNSITATPFHIKCSKKGYLNFVYKSSSPFLEIIKHFFHQTSLFKKKDVFLYTAKEYLRRCTVQKN